MSTLHLKFIFKSFFVKKNHFSIQFFFTTLLLFTDLDAVLIIFKIKRFYIKIYPILNNLLT